MTEELKKDRLTSSGLRSNTILTEIQVGIARDLTENEKLFIHSHNREINRMLMNNSYNNHLDTIKEGEEERKALMECFLGMMVHVAVIPNEYDKQTGHPWYLVTTVFGPVKIGWRKRVIEIDWALSDIKQTAEMLFPEEDVTKTGTIIHAWSNKKAASYIQTLLNNRP